MSRKCIHFLLTLLVVFGLCSTTVLAMDDTPEKTTENGFNYRICTSYTGTEQFIEITGYTGNASIVEIPDMIEGLPVTHIADYGLENSYFTAITLPDTLLNIGSCAFSSCGALTVVDIPDSVTSIGRAPFMDCTSLTAIRVGDGNTSYYSDDRGVLYNKAQTTLYQIPGALSGDYAIADTVTFIESAAINGCQSLTSITIPAATARYAFDNFVGCSALTQIHVAEGNPNFSSHQGALLNGDKSTLLVIPYGFTGAFTLPATVETFHNDFQFPGQAMTAFYVEDGNPCYSSDAYGVLFNKDKTTLIRAPGGLGIAIYDVPATVQKIESYAFAFCDQPTQFVFSGDAPEQGNNAFSSNPAKKKILYYPANNATWTDAYLRQYASWLTLVAYEGTYPDVFAPDFSCELVDSVLTISGHGKMPDVTKQPDLPWYRYKNEIREVIIEEGITSVSNLAFYWCDKLTTVTLADSITTIGEDAFADCPLESINVPANLKSIGNQAFLSCPLSSFSPLPYGLTDIGYRAFYCSGVTSMEFPSTLVSIGEQAFADCQKLTEVTFLGGSADIQSRAFAFIPFGTNTRSMLSKITFLGDLPLLAADAFKDVTADAYYPPNNDSWTAEAMHGYGGNLTWEVYDLEGAVSDGVSGVCSDTTNWSLADGILSISASQDAPNAISRIATPMSTQIRMPDYSNIEATPWYRYRTMIERIVVRGGVEYIGANAFFSLPNVTEVYIGSDVSAIGSDSFGACPQVETITFYGDAPAMDNSVFAGTTAAISYPADNATWDDAALGAFGDDVTHEPYEGTPPEIPEPRNNPFTDIKRGSYYYDAVLWAADQGIASGITNTTFVPGSQCTRAQAVTFLWRASGKPEPSSSSHPFTDANEKAYYYKAMLWAVENGITAGMTSTTFEPDRVCTRGQVVTFLWRAAGKPEPSSTSHPFTDINEKAYYYNAMLWAVEDGITAGMTPTTFEPERTCTRGQVVTFLYRNYAD